MKMRVIKFMDDPANRLNVGDTVDIPYLDLFYEDDIVNIGGAHYKVEELNQYFEIVEDNNEKRRQA